MEMVIRLCVFVRLLWVFKVSKLKFVIHLALELDEEKDLYFEISILLSDFPAIPFILVLGILQINNVQQKNCIGWRDNIT